MATSNEIIDKYYEEYPEYKELADKYVLSNDSLEVDSFNGRIYLKDEAYEKFLKAYEITFSKEAYERIAKKDGKKYVDKLCISGLLYWVDENYNIALDKFLVYKFSKKDSKFNFVNLSKEIPKAMKGFSLGNMRYNSDDIKRIVNHYSTKFANIDWNEKEYDIYRKAMFSKKNDDGSWHNEGVTNVLYDNSFDLLDVLRTLKKAPIYLEELDKNLLDTSFINELENIKYNDSIILNLYSRLINEGNFEQFKRDRDEFFLADEIISCNKDNEDENDLSEKNNDTRDEVIIPTIVSPEVIADVNEAFKNYIGMDYSNSVVVSNITKGIVEKLYGLGKSIYDFNSDSYDEKIIVDSIVQALKDNGIETSLIVIQYFISEVKNKTTPVVSDTDEELDNNENNLEVSDEIVEDIKSTITKDSIDTLINGTAEQKAIVVKSLFYSLKGTGIERYNIKSDEFNKDVLIDSFYAVLKEYGIERAFIEKNIVVDYIREEVRKAVKEEFNGNDISEIFNKLPEKDIKNNLDKLYNSTLESKHDELDKCVLKEFSKLINGAVYGSIRDIEVIEKQFNIFCSEHGINYNEEFINSLPEVLRDRYSSPIIQRENAKPQKGQVFEIIRRYTPTTSVKTQKRLYATLAGVGIMSFLFMTIVRLKTPESATESCTDTFERLLSSEMLANIFGDIKTYFASIASSVGGVIGYVAKDEQENKSKRM